MKLKSVPEDFRVEEIATPPPLDPLGPYQVFRVEKRGMAPLEALGAIARVLRVGPGDVAFAGLKDLRSQASQLASVRLKGPPLATPFQVARGLRLEPLGRAARPVSSEDIARNRFAITVRDIGAEEAHRLPARIDAVRRSGLANYFDDQRFGGSSRARGFIAELWSRGDLEGALRLLIARPSPKDPKRERLEKKLVSVKWGRWGILARELSQSPSAIAGVVRRLERNPRDQAGAFRALEQRLRMLLVEQYQSFLWNEAVVGALRGALPRAELFEVMYRAGTLAFWRDPDDGALAALRRAVPFEVFPIPEEIGVAAKAGERALTIVPPLLEAEEPIADELNPERLKVALRLELPRGAYATLVVKRLFYEGACPVS